MLRTRVVEERPEYGAFYTAMYTAAHTRSTGTLCIHVYAVYSVYCIRIPQPMDKRKSSLSSAQVTYDVQVDRRPDHRLHSDTMAV